MCVVAIMMLLALPVFSELMLFLVLVVIGIIIIILLKAAIHFIIPIIAAVVVWFLTHSFLYAGIVFLVVAILQLALRRR